MSAVVELIESVMPCSGSVCLCEVSCHSQILCVQQPSVCSHQTGHASVLITVTVEASASLNLHTWIT